MQAIKDVVLHLSWVDGTPTIQHKLMYAGGDTSSGVATRDYAMQLIAQFFPTEIAATQIGLAAQAAAATAAATGTSGSTGASGTSGTTGSTTTTGTIGVSITLPGIGIGVHL